MRRWADDATWTSGPKSGLNTKDAMTDAEVAQGLVGGVSLLGDHINWYLNKLIDFYDRLLFGSGTDGDVTISTGVSLTRNMFYNSLVVDGSGTLTPDGYVIRARDSITVQASGLITGNGTAGSNSSGGTGGGGGAAHAAKVLGVSGAGAAGGNDLANGGNASALTYAYGGWGANGGAGTSTTAGSGAVASLPTAGPGADPQAIEEVLPTILTGHQLIGGTLRVINGGAGGGGGGGGVGASTAGGGGGAGGRLLILAAPIITIAGSITAIGGVGGTGGADSGGGGGGGGGAIILVGRTINISGSTSVLGGAGGTGGANPGGTGTAGTVTQIKVL